ncbi:MAG TPA: hypothetical protein VN253_19270, partial [Kofleriaceae bacterium]|nr:hypothetical protein [Kofleriaceae bacterium]
MSRHRAKVTIFSYDKGGRPGMPVGSGFSPDACTPGGQERLQIILCDVPATATLDEEFDAWIELRYPGVRDYSVLLSGRDFDLVEGVKRVGRARLL